MAEILGPNGQPAKQDRMEIILPQRLTSIEANRKRTDGGGGMIRVAGDARNHLISIDFGRSISWLKLTPDQAEQLGNELLKYSELSR